MKLYRFTLTPQSAMGTPLVGDTLFGQFCWAVRNRFGEARLIELLEGYTEQRPFIVVSDAFPQGFLPLPTLPSTFWETKTETDRKSLKKAQWVNISDVEKRVVKFWQECALQTNFKFEKENQDQFHNTIDRQTNTTGEGQFAPYSTEIAWFGSKQEFDLYIVLDETRFSLEELQQILDDVGTFGFGRDASIGLGKFRCNNPQEVNFYQQNANCYFTLANSALENLGLDKDFSYKDLFYCIYEKKLEENNINRIQLYDFHKLYDVVNKNINENKNISLTYETKSIIPMQKNKFTKVITNSIIKDFSNQF